VDFWKQHHTFTPKRIRKEVEEKIAREADAQSYKGSQVQTLVRQERQFMLFAFVAVVAALLYFWQKDQVVQLFRKVFRQA
jgi:hypothetical protein